MAGPADGLFALGILASVALCWLALQYYRRWDEPGTTALVAFIAVLGLGGVVAGGASLLLGPTYGDDTVWVLPTFIALLLWCVPWFVFGLQYTGRYTNLGRRQIATLYVPHLLVATLVGLEFGTPVDLSGVEPLIGGAIGLYMFGLLTVGIALVLKSTLEYRHVPTGGGVAIVAAPIAVLLVANTGNVPSTPAVIAGLYLLAHLLPAIALGIVYLRYDVFETPPAVGNLGERAIVQEIDDLMLVLDTEDRLVKANPAAVERLGIGDEATEAPIQSLIDRDLDTLRERETVPVETVDGTKQYDSQVSTLTDDGGRTLGSLVSLHDVTEHELREQRLAVLNRVLRHNLRNKVEIVKSHAEVLAENGEDEHTTTIVDTADAIADLGRNARTIDSFVAESVDVSMVDLDDAVQTALDAVDATATGVTVTTEIPPDATVGTKRRALASALESALENAIEYADARVSITVTETGDGYTVRIADDGPGIPDDELESLDLGRETPLQHSTGLGLWQLKWAVKTMHGELQFETDDGTTVEFTIPHQEPAPRNGELQPEPR